MFRLTFKELLAKKLRLLTTALAVMLGVAFMAGTLVLTDTMNNTFDSLLSDAYSGTDAYVRGVSELDSNTAQTPRVDESVVDAVAEVPGVAASFGFVSGYSQLVDHHGKAVGNPGNGAPVVGETWIADETLNPYRLAEGHAPAARGEIVIDKHSAEEADLAIGETVSVLSKVGANPFTIVGIARFGDADSAGGMSAVLYTLEDAQTYVSAPGEYNSVLVRAGPGVSEETLTASIAEVLPSDVEVLTGAQITEETQRDIKDSMGFFNTFLLIFAGIALFVGAFIIFNTFSIIVTQRQKEMALLRAIGASGKQVVRSVLVEAAITGAVASVVGLGAGIGVAAGLKQLLSGFGIDLPAGGLAINSSTVITSLVVGTVVTLASAYFPARKAGKVPPVAAMRAVALDRTGASRKRMVVGSAVTAAGVGSLLAGLNGASMPLVGLGALVTFVGVAVLAPVLARPSSRLLGLPMAKATKMSGSLARENAMRNPKRTAATAAALMIGVALVGFIATFAASTKESINSAVDSDFNGDFVIDSGSFEAGTGGLSHQLAAQIAARPEFAAVTSDRGNEVELDGESNMLVSWDTATFASMLDVETQQGDSTTLGADGIAVLDDYAEDHHLQLGSTVPVVFAQGDVTLTVKAIYGNATWVGDAFVDHAVPDSLGIDPLDSAILVKLADGVTPADGEAVLDELTASYPTADVLDREGFKETKASSIDLIINLIYALLALAILIALMGITNTLALSIFERTRELGVLRAVGMTRAQLKATVRYEAVIIAVFGTLLGLGIGLFFGWGIVQALSDQGIDELVIPVPTLAIVTTVAAAAGVLASVLPARRAARLDVLGAIAAQ